jgi:NAD(P)H-nitrite reductase large subunit
MHHVILGAGPAGVIAAETLRKQDTDAQITLVSGEKEPPYSRMAIPYLLSGQIKEAGTYLRQDKTHFDMLEIAVEHRRTKAINAKEKSVAFDDGNRLSYDRLLIATGASPIRPPVPGLDLPGVRTCWTLDDARAIRMVPRMMDDVAGNMLRRWCEQKGVRVLTGVKITEIDRRKDRLDISLSNGPLLTAKLVVVAAGVAPNIGFLQGSGIKTNTGIKVSDRLKTSARDVYAAGDVAEARDLSTGAFSVLAIQPVAADHGRIAALNMAGVKTPHEGSLNMNVLDTMGLISSSFGKWDGVKDGDSVRMQDDGGFRYLRLEFEEDRLIGAQAVGLTDHIGMTRGLIQTGLSLGQWKDRLMKGPERIAEAYIAAAQGISPAH